MVQHNKCRTYFKIVGNFNPDKVTEWLGLQPDQVWHIGDSRKNNTTYDFAAWFFGMNSEYNIIVEKQMLATIAPLQTKIDVLQQIKNQYDVDFILEIVSEIYVGEITPCLAPSQAVMQFCVATETTLDIDLYAYHDDSEVVP